MHLKVTSDVMARMRAATAQAHPLECCGILLGKGDRITDLQQAANVHAAPMTHFEIDPQALIDAHRAARNGGLQVIGYYHSHPAGEARPSQTDRLHASGDSRIWAIISAGEVTFWQDEADGFRPLSYEQIRE